MIDWSKVKYFNASEWQNDPQKASPLLVTGVDHLRGYISAISGQEVQIHIHVCWSQDGHSESSYHYTGQAVDLHFEPVVSYALQMTCILSMTHFGGVGFYPEWNSPGWHLDMRNENPRVVWTRRNMEYIYTPLALLEAVTATDEAKGWHKWT